MSRVGGDSGGKAGELFSVTSSDLSYGLYVSTNDLTVLCSEGVSGFLFSKSSGQREMSIVSGYY